MKWISIYFFAVFDKMDLIFAHKNKYVCIMPPKCINQGSAKIRTRTSGLIQSHVCWPLHHRTADGNLHKNLNAIQHDHGTHTGIILRYKMDHTKVIC